MFHYSAFVSFASFLLPLFLFPICESVAAPTKTYYLVEAEDFQFKGAWDTLSGKSISSGGAYLRVLSGKESATDARTVIDLPESGQFTIWTSARDYPESDPGTRRCVVLINGKAVEKESGLHGKSGFVWEKVGTVEMPAGENVLAIHDVTSHFARFDAILLAKDPEFDPRKSSFAALRKNLLKPKQVAVRAPAPLESPARFVPDSSWTLKATLQNDQIKIGFYSGKDADGKSVIWRKTSIWSDGKWIELPFAGEAERVALLYSAKPGLTYAKIYPFWNNSQRRSSFEAAGKSWDFVTEDDGANPFYAGGVEWAIPRDCIQKESGKVELSYQQSNGTSVSSLWTLGRGGKDVRVEFAYDTPQAGYYSIGFAPFQGWSRDAVEQVQLPPMFQYQRLPEKATMVPSALMPQLVAIVQPATGSLPIPLSVLISADPDFIPHLWGNGGTSAYGFSLLNVQDQVQPVAFSPLLGNATSFFKPGQKLKVGFRVAAIPGDWKIALEYASASIMGVDDYRKQDRHSLTESLYNMIDLLADDNASGWDVTLKGFYDIEVNPEVSPTVVQASPLAVLSIARLTADEDFYARRALPTIEYTLSRPGFRFSDKVETPKFRTDPQSLVLELFSTRFDTAYYQGLDTLLGHANPWIKELALPGGKPRVSGGYGVKVPAWSQLLASYRFNARATDLAQARKEADLFISREIYGQHTNVQTTQPFYNTAFYPYWWDLLDLYDATGDRKYVEAAEEAAFQTIAGLRSYPVITDDLVTINATGTIRDDIESWWKGKEKFRLGFPLKPGALPEKKVPESLVSPVGLGIEQPATFFKASGGGVKHIHMSCWAPTLLRLYQYTGRDIFRIYARNTLIGRFANYPGYYPSAYTDVYQSPEYPWTGPDLTNLYYHHIAPHWAFSYDFLITEAGERSGGKIRFPWSKQQGFAWFSNRIYGVEEGQVFSDDKAKLLLDRKLVRVDSPWINFLTAQSKGTLWTILMNESATAVEASVRFSDSETISSSASGKAFHSDGSSSSIALNQSGLIVTVPPKGLVALSFPSKGSARNSNEIPSVENGYQTVGIPGVGTLHAFRIRSPFGKDSLYAFISGRPEGLRATLQLTQPFTKSLEIERFPYEWSLYPLAMTSPIELSVQVRRASGEEKTVGPIRFPASAAPNQIENPL